MNQKASAGLRALVDRNDDNWLITTVDAYLEKTAESRRDGGWFHPSSLASVCDAKLAFEFIGALASSDWINARLCRIFDNGHGRDKYWKGYLGKMGVSLVPRHPNGTDIRGDCDDCGLRRVTGRHICIPELRLRGEFDDHVRNPHDGTEHIFEFKTMNDNQWKRLKEPLPAHMIQVHCYMAGANVRDGMVMYENKNDQLLKQFNVPFDYGLWTPLVERLERIVKALKAGYDPDRIPDRCDGCQFQETCRKPDAFQNLPKWLETVDVIL